MEIDPTEIDEWTDFIKLCEKQIKRNKNEHKRFSKT